MRSPLITGVVQEARKRIAEQKQTKDASFFKVCLYLPPGAYAYTDADGKRKRNRAVRPPLVPEVYLDDLKVGKSIFHLVDFPEACPC
jgi:hypothetical protein